jgi:hypothetical protein
LQHAENVRYTNYGLALKWLSAVRIVPWRCIRSNGMFEGASDHAISHAESNRWLIFSVAKGPSCLTLIPRKEVVGQCRLDVRSPAHCCNQMQRRLDCVHRLKALSPEIITWLSLITLV